MLVKACKTLVVQVLCLLLLVVLLEQLGQVQEAFKGDEVLVAVNSTGDMESLLETVDGLHDLFLISHDIAEFLIVLEKLPAALIKALAFHVGYLSIEKTLARLLINIECLLQVLEGFSLGLLGLAQLTCKVDAKLSILVALKDDF